MEDEKKVEKNRENTKGIKKKCKKEIVVPVITLVVGILIGLFIMYIIKPSTTIARVDGKSITENQIYDKLQKYYSKDVLNMILEDVDDVILTKKYKEDDKMTEEIEEEANKYIESYIGYYGGTKEDFLEECGFESEEDLKNYLKLEYRRNLYYIDYLADVLGQDAIQEYYDEHNFGEIQTKHILVQTSDDMTEDQATAMAKEIITKLNNGANFDEVAEEYKTNYPDTIIVEDLGGLTFADSIEEIFMDALKAMEDNTYSQEPVVTTYGAHVIYRTSSKELSIEDARNDIVVNLYSTLEDVASQSDKLIELRKNAGLKFKSEKFKDLYDELYTNY